MLCLIFLTACVTTWNPIVWVPPPSFSLGWKLQENQCCMPRYWGRLQAFNKYIVIILISIKTLGAIKLIILKLIKKIKAQSQIHHTSSLLNSSCIKTKITLHWMHANGAFIWNGNSQRGKIITDHLTEPNLWALSKKHIHSPHHLRRLPTSHAPNPATAPQEATWEGAFCSWNG